MQAETSERTQSGRLTKWLVSTPPFAFLIFFFLLPALIMVVASFRFPGEYGALAPMFGSGGAGEETGLTLENYGYFFGDRVYAQIFLKSFGVAALATALILVVTQPLAPPPVAVEEPPPVIVEAPSTMIVEAPPPAPPPAAPAPEHVLTVRAEANPASVEVGRTSTVTATAQSSIGCAVTYRWSAPSGTLVRKKSAPVWV